MFDRIKDLISEPGSIQDKLGNLQEQFTGGGGIQEHLNTDTLQDQLGTFGGLDAIGEQLTGVEFPIARDDLTGLLEGRGVPTQITDRLQHLDVTQFQSRDDVLGRISGFLGR